MAKREKLLSITLELAYTDSSRSPILSIQVCEACGDYYEFTVSRLLNTTSIPMVSAPRRYSELKKTTKLSCKATASNPDFITVKFTHDLDTISLNRNKAAREVLELL